MDQIPQFDFQLRRFGRRMLRINVCRSRLEGLRFKSPVVSSLYHSSSERELQITALLFNALEAEPELVSVSSAPQCRSRLPRVLHDLRKYGRKDVQPWTVSGFRHHTSAEQLEYDRDYVPGIRGDFDKQLSVIQSLIHRALDSTIGRRRA
jgi:hypothetical protein